MDTIAAKPITPPTPAPVAEAPSQREGKDKDDEVKEGKGFDKKLKDELAALMPGADAAAQLPATDPTATDATAIVDPSLVTDPKAAADAAAQALAAAAVPVAAQALNNRPDGKPAHEVGDVLGAARAERGAVEQSAAERGSAEQGAVHRTAQERRELRLSREADNRMDAGKEKSAVGDAKDALAGAFAGAEHAAAPVAAEHAKTETASSTPSALDGLSSASLVQKWAANAPMTDAPAPATARIDTPLGAPGWADAFQQKIVWLIDREQQSAELHLNPPNLGPVDVMLDLKDDGSTRVAFCSPHAMVREVIESNMADLQANLAGRGIDLSQTFVGADSSAAREQFAAAGGSDGQGSGSGRQSGGHRGSASAPVVADAPRRQVVTSRSLVDIFA